MHFLYKKRDFSSHPDGCNIHPVSRKSRNSESPSHATCANMCKLLFSIRITRKITQVLLKNLAIQNPNGFWKSIRRIHVLMPWVHRTSSQTRPASVFSMVNFKKNERTTFLHENREDRNEMTNVSSPQKTWEFWYLLIRPCEGQLMVKNSKWALFLAFGRRSVEYPPGNQHIPPGEKENHLQNGLLRGYVSSLEGIKWSSNTFFFENSTRDTTSWSGSKSCKTNDFTCGVTWLKILSVSKGFLRKCVRPSWPRRLKGRRSDNK